MKEVVLPPADGRSKVPRGEDPSEDVLVCWYGSNGTSRPRGCCSVWKEGRVASFPVGLRDEGYLFARLSCLSEPRQGAMAANIPSACRAWPYMQDAGTDLFLRRWNATLKLCWN